MAYRNSVHYDRTTRQFVGLDAPLLKQLHETYEAVDVDQELKKMCLWLLSEKGTRRIGNINFILNWLNNATPIKRTTTEELDLLESDTPLGHLLRDYLQDLWKNSGTVHHFNQIKR